MDPTRSNGRSMDSGDVDLEATAPSGVEDVAPEPEAEDLPAVGAKIGRYTVLDRVGAGGMGVVYAAFDPELDRKVALKVLHQRGGNAGSDGRERLLREAKAMARLSHPNVITVHDVGTFHDRVFIAMEFIDGPTLRGWLRQGSHEWTEIVEVFVKAGRGLAAAHAAGLIHRDFKPDNVLIGRGGRVLVMDFGLARQASSSLSEAQPTKTPRSIDMSNLVLTRTGMLVGTPAYMAPEQHRGAKTTPLMDQFSFCVALYEALYSERPFAGNSVASLAINVLEGEVRSAPKGTRVPSWLRAVVLRGLSRDPQDRFPSMDALLAELQRDPPESRRPWVSATIALAVVALAGGAYVATLSPDLDPCEASYLGLDEQWGASQRDAVRDAFSATGLPFADTSGQSTVRRIDAWSERWSQQWMELCHAAAPEPSSDTSEVPSLRCLDVLRHDLRALVDQLAEADEGTVEGAVAAASALPDPALCADVDLLLAISDRMPPESSDSRDRLEHLRRAVARARVQLHTGAPAEAARIAEPLLDLAKTLQDPGLEAEAGLVLARALDLQDEPGLAERRLRQVVVQAASGRRPRLEAEAWIELTKVVGERMGKHDEGHRLALAAEASIVRADDPGLRARLSMARADLEIEQGRYDEAREHLEELLEVPPDPNRVPELVLAEAWQDLGVALDGLGRFTEAGEDYERTLAIREQVLGAQHPQVGAILARLGGAMLGSDRLLQADATFVRARWLLDPLHITDDEQSLPPPTMSAWQRRELATVLDRQGLLMRAQEELETAEQLHRQALAILEDTLGSSHRDLGYPLTNLGLVLTEQGRPVDGLTQLRRAREILRAELDEHHPDLATVSVDLANALWSLGDYVEARELYSEALAIWEEALPEDHPLLGYALTGIGRCDVQLRTPDAAIEPLERALELRSQDGEERLNVAETKLVLARALWASGGDLGRALELATSARDLAGAVEPSDDEGFQRLLGGADVPRLTDLLVPAGLGATNRNTRGR
ncbi:MAG: tetratricopeptide repeat protein [Myxococcales bacterium]|nr:tetratricopeptide repeat protein [Myxococcales bacterium]MCB9714609.1 tetratricopeptide repeat protein [Myxococcales bacterium]